MRGSSAGTDPAATAEPAGRPRRILRVLLIAGLASAAFLVSLAATLPARVAAGYVSPPVEINGYSGTVWNGAAGLQGGHALRWRVDGWRSLAAFSVVLDAALEGPGTALGARVTAQGLGAQAIRIEGLDGVAAWPLVAALAPEIGIACADATARIEDVALTLAPGRRGGSGRAYAGPGFCARVGRAGEAAPLPALAAVIAGGEAGLGAVLTLAETPDEPLAEAVLANDDRLVLTVYPEGAALVPGLPTSGEIILEYPLDGLPF